MKKVQEYIRPTSLEEALAAKAAMPDAVWLAGGTFVLAGDGRDKPETVIDLANVLPRNLERLENEIVIDAGVTFQTLADSPLAPPMLRASALQMANRNVRNQATVGGNLGAGKTCASLLPPFLALDAMVRVASFITGAGFVDTGILLPLAEWLDKPVGLILDVRVKMELGRHAASLRWSRSDCDLSVLIAAVSFFRSRESAGAPSKKNEPSLILKSRIALGGFGPHARRFPELEKLFDLKPLPSRDEIAALVRPLLPAIDDHRGSAAFKKLRGAELIADAFCSAEAL